MRLLPGMSTFWVCIRAAYYLADIIFGNPLAAAAEPAFKSTYWHHCFMTFRLTYFLGLIFVPCLMVVTGSNGNTTRAFRRDCDTATVNVGSWFFALFCAAKPRTPLVAAPNVGESIANAVHQH